MMIAVALALWAGMASAQESISGKFVYYPHAQVLHLKGIFDDGVDLRLIPPLKQRMEMPPSGEYRIDLATGDLWLERRVSRICEWPGWAAVHAHPKLSRLFTGIAPIGDAVETITGAIARAIGVCKKAMKQ